MKKWETFPQIQPDITVVVATYNRLRELEICLEGFKRQSLLDFPNKTFQLILADDGSSPAVENLFKKFSESVSFPVTYLYQEDNGWGKLRMLNWTVLEAKAPWIVFLDADCVPHRHFVREHLNSARPNTVSCGRRVDIMERIAPSVTVEHVREGVLDSFWWILKNSIKDELDYGEKGFYLPSWLAKTIGLFSKNKTPTILGSNFSIEKKWLLDVNGFDETFPAPGYGEDTDLERRLALAGLKFQWVNFRAIQFHLWHPLTIIGKKSEQVYEDHKLKNNKEALKGIRELQQNLPRH